MSTKINVNQKNKLIMAPNQYVLQRLLIGVLLTTPVQLAQLRHQFIIKHCQNVNPVFKAHHGVLNHNHASNINLAQQAKPSILQQANVNLKVVPKINLRIVPHLLAKSIQVSSLVFALQKLQCGMSIK